MPHELLIAAIGGLGAMLGWGLADFFGKITIDEIGDVISLVWAHILGTIIFLLVIFYQMVINHQTIGMPQSMNGWLLLIFFGVLQAVVYLLVYKGFGKGQVSILNPVFASFTGLVALFSIFVLGEIESSYLLIGLAIIFIGVMLINVDFEAFKQNRLALAKVPGMKEILFATLLAAIWTLAWDKFVGGHDWFSYAFFMYVFMTLAIIAVAKFQKVNLRVMKPRAWKFLFLIGLCESIAYVALSLGYSLTSLTSVVALLSGAFSLPTIILARLFLKEKLALNQALGGLIIVLGIILLAVV